MADFRAAAQAIEIAFERPGVYNHTTAAQILSSLIEMSPLPASAPSQPALTECSTEAPMKHLRFSATLWHFAPIVECKNASSLFAPFQFVFFLALLSLFEESKVRHISQGQFFPSIEGLSAFLQSANIKKTPRKNFARCGVSNIPHDEK